MPSDCSDRNEDRNKNEENTSKEEYQEEIGTIVSSYLPVCPLVTARKRVNNFS
jgi:hypothetical protein